VAQRLRKKCLRFTGPRPGFAVLAVAWISLLVAGCGFQLRGQANLPFDRIYVESNGFSLFAAELRRIIQSAKSVEVVDTAEQAQVVLQVLGESQERKILSLSPSGSVNEYQLLYQVRYRVMNNQMNDLAAPGDISLHRDMTYDDTETLGKESEEQLLFRSMQIDAVQQMLRRLSVVMVES